MFWIAYRGLRGRPALALMSAIGIALAVGLAVSVPVFAQAVSRAIMEEELNDLYAQVGRSPLAVRFHLLPSAARPFTSRQSQEMAFHIAHAIETHVGIPWVAQTSVESAGLMLRTAGMALTVRPVRFWVMCRSVLYRVSSSISTWFRGVSCPRSAPMM